MKAREHLKQAGFSPDWDGYREHVRHALRYSARLVLILFWSVAHAVWPGWFPFKARNAVIDLCVDLEREAAAERHARFENMG